MADEQNKQTPSLIPANPQPVMEVGAPSKVTTADMSRDGTAKVSDSEEDSHSVSLGADGKFAGREAKELADGEDLGDVEGNELDAPDLDVDSEGTKPEDATEGGEPQGDLPEFDFGNEEVLKAYDAKYTHADESGETVINLNAFNESLAASIADGDYSKADISKNERSYLKKAFGISDAMIDQHIRGLVADAKAYDAENFSKFGGQEGYNGAMEWATTGKGYTEAQQKKYSDAVTKFRQTGDRTDLDDQIDLLAARFKAANPGAVSQQTQGKSFRERRPSSPATQATKVTTSPKAPEVFKNSEEHRLAQADAERSGDPAKMRAVSEKLSRSMKQAGWH